MANIVESFMDKMKYPEKAELSHADRQLIQKLSASVEELKTKETVSVRQLAASEKHILARIDALSDSGSSSAPESSADFSELRQYIADENEKSAYKLRGLIEHKADEAQELLKALQTSDRADELIKYAEVLSTCMLEAEARLSRQLRTVKIMMGFAIWISIMALAALTAQVLGLI